MRKFIYVAPVLLLAVMLLVGAGCEVTTDTTDDTNTTADTNTATTTDTDTDTDTDTGSLWTSATDQGDISDLDATGTLNEKTFTVAHVQVTNWGDSYTWYFSDSAPDDDCGVIMDDNAVSFSSKDIQVGTFSATYDDVEFDDYSLYYYYEQEDGTPMSINESWDATFVVNEFNESVGVIGGHVDVMFDDGTNISGAFEGEVCDF